MHSSRAGWLEASAVKACGALAGNLTGVGPASATSVLAAEG